MSETRAENKENIEADQPENMSGRKEKREHRNLLHNYKSPISNVKAIGNYFNESARKDGLDLNVSPLWKDFLHQIKRMNNWTKDSKRAFNLISPKSPNKWTITISPQQNDSFSWFQKDDFQLKNSSEKKHSKLIDFIYPDTLLSKSNSSKKTNVK